MVQHITDEDKVALQQFCVEMFDRIAVNETFLDNVGLVAGLYKSAEPIIDRFNGLRTNEKFS